MNVRYHTPSPESYPVPVPDATLINGKGRYPGGPAVPLSNVNVNFGLRYRFRLVSISCLPNFNFSIDGHTMACLTILFSDSSLAHKTFRPSSKLTASASNHWWLTPSRYLPDSDTPSFYMLGNQLTITGYVRFLMLGRKAFRAASTWLIFATFSHLLWIFFETLRVINLSAACRCLKPTFTRC